jgi:hypothetical protein
VATSASKPTPTVVCSADLFTSRLGILTMIALTVPAGAAGRPGGTRSGALSPGTR